MSSTTTTPLYSTTGRLFLLLPLIGILLNLLTANAAEFQCSNNNTQNSYLWRIETTPPVYLYGTMHVPYKKIWPKIPENVKRAFSDSDHLCVELQLTDKDTLQKLAACRQLPKGGNVRNILPRDLYIRVLKYLIRVQYLFPRWLFGDKEGSNSLARLDSDRLFNAIISGWDSQRPIWLLMLLSSLSRDNIRDQSVPSLDVFLDRGAQGMGKAVDAVETYKEQCRPFNRLNNTKVITALRVLLDHLEPQLFNTDNGPLSTLDSDLDTYHCGDFLELTETTPILPIPPTSSLVNVTESDANDLAEINEYLIGQIVHRRNRRITKKLDELLKRDRNETFFFALGAGHFLGSKSIVRMLERKNYQVTRISVDEEIEGPALPDNFIELGDPSSSTTLRIIKIPNGIIATPPSTTAPPPSLPTLSPDIVSKIINEAVNKSQSKYKIDSFEVTPSITSSVTTPTPSPSQQAPTTGSTTKTINNNNNNNNLDSTPLLSHATSSSMRWLVNFNILISSLLTAVLLIIINYL